MNTIKRLFFVITLLFFIGNIAMAQGGGQRRTVEERVKRVHDKIDSAFKLEPAKLAQSDSAFATYYRATDKVRESMTAEGGQPDFQAMRAKMQPYADARDKDLKVIYGEENYKKWKDEIEPALRPRGGQGGNR
jgi:phosphoglycerate-specific signal transduction histidine kinase